MRLRTFLAGVAILGLIMPAAAAATVTVQGGWTTEAHDAVVEIAPCGASLCGRIAKFLKPPPGGIDQRDVRNPNEQLRGRKLLGLSVLTGFTRDGNEWRGRIYDPKSGKDYRSVLATNGNTLIVKGCIGPFCKSQTWTRAG